MRTHWNSHWRKHLGALQKTSLIFSTGKKQPSLPWAMLQLCTWLTLPGCHLSIHVEAHTSRCHPVPRAPLAHPGVTVTTGLASPSSLYPATFPRFSFWPRQNELKSPSSFKAESYFCHRNIWSVNFQDHSRTCITLLMSTSNLNSIISTLVFLTSTATFSSS